MVGPGCICVVCMGLDASAICSTSRAYGSRRSLRSPDWESHVGGGLFLLREPIAKGAAEVEAEGTLARSLGVVGTVVNSCSSSSLAVPAVEFDTLSIEKRDMISSRVDAFRGRAEKREESAVERRLEARLGTLGGVETVVGE